MLDAIKKKVPIGAVNLLLAKAFKKKFPHAVQLNLNYRCNLRCTYCNIYEDTRPEMSTEEIFQMLDSFARMGASRLSITGGEPMLRKDIAEVISHAKKLGMFVSLATNGNMVARRINYIREVDSVNMTLDGPESIHDLQRGRGQFRKVLEAGQVLKENNIPFYFNTVLTKNNCDRLDEILDIIRGMGAKVMLQPVFYSEESHAGDLEGYRETRYENEQLIAALEKLIALKNAGDDIILLSKRYYQNVINSVRRNEMMFCKNGGSMFVTVSPDGHVTPCNLLSRGEKWLKGSSVGFEEAYKKMPCVDCDGCISSFMDIDDLYDLKPDVVWNYYRHFLKFFKGSREASGAAM